MLGRYKIRKVRILSVDPKFSYGFPEDIIVLSAKKKLGGGLEVLYLEPVKEEKGMEETERVLGLYAVVEDTPSEKCIVKSLWSEEVDAEEEARKLGLRVVKWGVLRKKRG
jgi:hypothetical protein